MTINKEIMGQALLRVALELRVPVFPHGQLYVALGWACKRGEALVVVVED